MNATATIIAGQPFTVLVMAASRPGANRVAELRGVAHKCLALVAGKEMLARVVDTLKATSSVGRIFVSIENDAVLQRSPLLAEMQARGDFTTIPSGVNIAQSVANALDRIDAPWPLLITTADNALHFPELVDSFCRDALQHDADAVFAVTRAETVLAKYPDGHRAFHKLRGGAYSGCNMYALLNPDAARAVRAFSTGGQFAKNPARMIGAFGLLSFLLWRLRALDLAQIMRRLSRVLGIRLEAGMVDFAEGPIDVDKGRDLELVERILTAREAV